MADIEKGLPVRTEDDADQYVRNRQFDSSNPALGQEVDADGNAHIEAHGNDPAGVDKVLKVSELGNANTDGDYDVTNNTKPSSNALIVHDRNAAPAETHQNFRPTGIQGTDDNTVHAQDVALHDNNGDAYTPENPMPVSMEESPGEEIHDHKEDVDVAAEGSSNHEYSVADGETFLLEQIIADASSRIKIELFIGDGAAVEVFTRKAVRFNSEKQGGDADLTFTRPIKVIGTANTTTVRVVKHNRDDDDAQSIYTTIVGLKRT